MKKWPYLVAFVLVGTSISAMEESSCSIDHDEEDFLCSVMTEYYFKREDRYIGSQVAPYLKPKIKDARKSLVNQLQILADKKRKTPDIDLRDSQDEYKDHAFFQCVQEMINDSLKEAFVEKDIESQRQKDRSNMKKLKLKIAMIGAGATLCATVMSVSAAIIVNLS